MPSVYDKDAFSQRVAHAAQCFLRGTSATRHFDTCFENTVRLEKTATRI